MSYPQPLLVVLLLSQAIAYSQMDNGVPLKEIKEWREVWNPTTGSHWRTKADERTGEVVQFDPFTAEIWRNPFTKKAEAVMREWNNDGVQDAKKEAASLLSSQTPKEDPEPRTVED